MSSKEIRSRFLRFFEKRGHAVIPSASLVPENDPTVLFNTAGMQPLVPYLMGQAHPVGDKIVDVQKCVRTTDIEDIGDNTHATFFEMLGNWSLGSYFKKEAITWSYEFLTSKEEGLGLDPNRLYVTVFEGDENAPRDEEAYEVWRSIGVPEHRIYFKGADSNWWPAVKGKDTWTGPTGPCSEMFYDLTEEGLGDMTFEEYDRADEAQKVVEIWNDVFMEYEKKDGQIVSKLSQKNVDTGAGLERLSAILQRKNNIFDTDLFSPVMNVAKSLTEDSRRQRILSDHIRSSVFMISDGVFPSNTDRGYILRRILRRAIFSTSKRSLLREEIQKLVEAVLGIYDGAYPEIERNKEVVITEIEKESEKFSKTINEGLKRFEKFIKNGGTNADKELVFILYTTFGFPIELTKELAEDKGISIDEEGARELLKVHQETSRKGAEQKFKGGLADTSEMSVKYHTATHLLNAALRQVLGTHVEQRGSNITAERLRFDFPHPEKMTEEEKKKVEDLVNEWIQKDLPVTREVMSKDAAFEKGALGVFGEKYGDEVSVYSIGDISMELCGGPHVEHTGVLGHFKIQKEESVSQGVRRIKAVLE